MGDLAILTESELHEFAVDWYKKLDIHAPVQEYAPLLAADVELRFPEGTVKGWDEFSKWYDFAINTYFDEVHVLKAVNVLSSSPEQSTIQVIVKWEASIWKAPAATSNRINLDAYQTWTMKRSPTTNQPIISVYIVDKFEYYEGSYQL